MRLLCVVIGHVDNAISKLIACILIELRTTYNTRDCNKTDGPAVYVYVTLSVIYASTHANPVAALCARPTEPVTVELERIIISASSLSTNYKIRIA